MGDVVQVGPLCLRFRSSDASVAARLGRLYVSFPEAAGDDVINVDIEPEERKGEAGWVARIDGEQVRSADSLALVEETLTRRINRLVLDAETDRLHLHAGAVERDGRVVLIIGTSGSGKSTLVASLVAAGWKLLSDEQLGVLDGGRLVAFPRPITLRRNSWPLFDDLDIDDPGERVDRIEVPVGDLGAAWTGRPVVPSLVVVPDVTVAEPGVERLSVADTVSTLLSDTLDLERSGVAGLASLLAIAGEAEGWRVAGTDLAETRAAVGALLDQAAPPGGPIDQTEAGGGSDPRAVRSHAWLFADHSAAIHDLDGGALAVTDEQGYRAWQSLGAPRSAWSPEMADSPFVDQLTEAGLLRTTST